MKEEVIDQKLQRNLNSLIENILEEKNGKYLDFFFNNKASQSKKKKTQDKKNKTEQHGKNKIRKLSN